LENPFLTGPSISDDKEESPVPTLGPFLDIQSALQLPHPTIPGPYTSLSPQTPNQRARPFNPADVPTSLVTCIVDLKAPSVSSPGAKGGQGLTSGANNPAVTANQPPKNAHIDYQTLGPIYGPKYIAKNKNQLNMINTPLLFSKWPTTSYKSL